MFKINNHVIVWDKKLLEELKNMENNEKVKNDFINNANFILEKARPKIAYNNKSKNAQHLRYLYEVKKPSHYKTKIEGFKVNSWKITLAPRGRYKIYYGVITAGVRRGKKIRYTDSNVIAYPIHNTIKLYEFKLREDFINGLRYKINDINRR